MRPTPPRRRLPVSLAFALLAAATLSACDDGDNNDNGNLHLSGLPSASATFPQWDELTPAQQADEARRMEVYAALVENLDHNIGRLIQYLKQNGAYDNTLIVFHADNGAEANDFDNFAGPGYDARPDKLAELIDLSEWTANAYDGRYRPHGHGERLARSA